MIFLCFSGKDRLTAVKSILFHLQKYGMDIWYDNYVHILGDDKNENYICGVRESQYAVVIYSPAFPDSPGAIEELVEIKQRYDNGLMHVFPIFYNIKANEIPAQDSWLCNLIYNEINDTTGTLLSCNQIVCKFFSDTLEGQEIPSLWEIKQNNLCLLPWMDKMLDTYFNIVSENINSRLTTLYCLFLFLESEISLPMYLVKTVNYLFATTKLHLDYNFKEIILMEQAVCIALSNYINCNHP